MKRTALLLLAAGLVVGCNNKDSTTADDTKKMTDTPKAADAGASAAKPKPKLGYFEMPRNGKTHVFGSVASMQKFNRGEQVATKSMDRYGPDGETVVFESSPDGETEKALMAEYAKTHPPKR